MCLKKTLCEGVVRVTVSNQDIKARIETIVSDILSRKHDAKITIKFVEQKEQSTNGNNDSSGDFQKE